MASAGKQTRLNFTATRPRPLLKKEDSSTNKPTTTGETRAVEQIEAELYFLRQFDLNLKYGPCLGLSRLTRWERAHRFGLSPPVEVKNIIKSSHGNTLYTECLWFGERGLV